MTPRVRLLLKILVSTTLAAIIVLSLDDVQDVGRLLLHAAPEYLLLALFVLTVDRFLMSYKWLVLLKSRGLHLPLVRGVQIYCSAMVWGMFLPATVGADAVRGYMTSRRGLDGYEVFASIAVERLVGFLASLLFGLIGLAILGGIGAYDERFGTVWWVGAATLLGATAALSVSFSNTLFDRALRLLPRAVRDSAIVRKLKHFHGIYARYGDQHGVMVAFFVLTLLEQCFVIAGMWFIALALGIQVSLLFMAAVVPLAMLLTRLPVSIDGIGVFEGVLILLLGLGGVGAAEAVALSIAGRLVQVLIWLPWWFSYTVQAGSLRPPKGAPQAP